MRLTLVMVVAAATVLGGCKPIWDAYYDTFFHGTVDGVRGCLSTIDATLLSKEVAKSFCAKKYAASIPSDFLSQLDGLAGPSVSGKEKKFEGTFRNSTPDYVVTFFVVRIGIYGSDGRPAMGIDAYVDGWFEPTSEGTKFVSAPITGLPDDWGGASLPYCESEPAKSCWTWSIHLANGLKI